MRRIAVVGDVHGCIDEFEELCRRLEHESLDAVFHLGDLVDRGPDSGAVVRKCIEDGIEGVLGNHESTILALYWGVKEGAKRSSPDKERTISQLTGEDFLHLSNLPLLHVCDDLQTVLVHAGIEPGIPLYRQSHAACHLQLIHPDHPGKTRWWGHDPKNNRTEEENRADGWRRWYEVADEPYLVLYGHSVFDAPNLHKQTLGLDTGCVYGGALTAVILPDMKFVSVPARKTYVDRLVVGSL